MRYAFYISAIVLLFCSCSNDSKSDLAVFEATAKSLEQSSKMISELTADHRKQLFDRLNDLRTAEQAAVWQPIAVKTSQLASSTIEYINTLKLQLAGESDNFQVVKKVFFQQNKGEELHRTLRNFMDSIYAVDTSPNSRYDEMLKDYLDPTKYTDKEFAEHFFNHVSTAAALSILAKFEHDIRNIENKIVMYCFYHIGSSYCGRDYFYPLISVSSTCVKAGDNIEMTAGIGSFSIASQPALTIDRKSFLTDENGVIVYKFKTSLKAGKYIKPVKIEYTKPDGNKESITKNIEYTVVEGN